MSAGTASKSKPTDEARKVVTRDLGAGVMAEKSENGVWLESASGNCVFIPRTMQRDLIRFLREKMSEQVN